MPPIATSQNSQFPENPLLNYFIRNGEEGIHKWVDYFEVYERCFSRFRGQPITFLEIGVQNGGSTRMWRNYFGPQAKIIGIDIDPNCMALESDDLEIWIGDQGDPAFWAGFCEAHPTLDVVLDDGGHTMQQQIVTLEALFPRLSDKGMYVCEDTHTSYFPGHGGSLRGEGTFIEYAKRLVDAMHAWYHAPLKLLGGEYWARHLYSVSFYDSIVAMEKRFRNTPLIVGRGNFGHVENPPALTFLEMRRAFGVAD